MDNITEDLDKIFYDPKNGFINMRDLYLQQKANGLKYTMEQVKKYYNDQEVNQIYKKPPKIKSFNKIVSPFNQIGTVQADLMDVQKLRGHNNMTKYLLNVVDVYSRYAWSFPLTNKKPETVKPHLEKVVNDILKASKEKIIKFTFTFDKGSEFRGAVTEYLNDKGIKIYLNDPHSLHSHNKMGLIERFNRTIRDMMKKYLSYNNTLRYIDVLDQFLYNYNNRIHSATKRKPVDVFHDKLQPVIIIDSKKMKELQTKEEAPIIRKYKIGDHVRSLKVRKTFDKKSFVPSYSLTVHTVKDIQNNRYVLDNGKVYYEEQLLKVNKNEGNRFDDYKQQIKQVDAEDKKKRNIEKDFQEKIEDVQKQVLPERAKRNRKQTSFLIHQ